MLESKTLDNKALGCVEADKIPKPKTKFSVRLVKAYNNRLTKAIIALFLI
jgi:hypothetical protein